MRSTSSKIITNPINIGINIARTQNREFWEIILSFLAFPSQKIIPKNIVFLLDASASMQKEDRLKKVQNAVLRLLDKLSPNDTFSIVSFNDKANTLMTRTSAKKEMIALAKTNLSDMKANGGTSFISAFAAINTRKIIPSTGHSAIIFLTDGEDTTCTADNLLKPFRSRQFVRIIPIGIYHLTLLDNLCLHGGKAIYINHSSEQDYYNAFDEAFRQATEQSNTQAQLEMMIETSVGKDSTKTEIQRELSHVCYDGKTPNSYRLYFHSPTPPCNLELQLKCDDAILYAKRRLTPDELKQITDSHSVGLTVTTFKWKNNSTSSWMMAFGLITTGLLTFAGIATFALSSLHLSLWMSVAISALAGLVGLYLLFKGMVAVAQKTLFLPTKATVHTDGKARNLEEKKQASQITSTISNSFFSPKKILTGSTLAAGGAVAGYFGGTAFAATATSTVAALGISASLFVTLCAVGGGMILPLLAYTLLRLSFGNEKTIENHSRSLRAT